MKRDILTLTLLLGFAVFAIILANCNGDEPEPNKPPTVSITSPTNNAIIEKGTLVQITVTASDPDGTVSNVKIYIDNVEEESFNAPPYSVNVATDEAEPGQYTIKAEATDNEGLKATAQITVTITESNPPTVTTADITEIQAESATGGGNVTGDGGNDVTVRGVVWSETTGPTVESNAGKTEDGSGTGEFTSSITGLTANTTYYVRAYATNNQGTAYGEEKSFMTLELATIVTGTVTDITHDSATGSGEITDDGGEAITARGLVWSLYPGDGSLPTLEENLGFTEEGSGIGSFTSTMTSLSPNTQYQVRAYATNIAGTAYGDLEYFWTLEGPLSLTTLDITDIDAHVAVGSGTITDFGGADVLLGAGLVWGLNPNPDITGDYVNIYQMPGFSITDDNPFTVPIFELEPETTYYVRAFAANSTGTYYGDQKTFTTTAFVIETGSFTDTRDGNAYNTITLNGQTWMAENLAYLPEVCASDADCGYWVYDYQGTDTAAAKASVNYDTYGVLYNREMAMQGCPAGWHLPSRDDWTIFEMNLGMSYWSSTGGQILPGTDEGGKLKEAGTSHWDSPNVGATNISQFTALPAGQRSTNDIFDFLGSLTTYWTSDISNTTDSYVRALSSNQPQIYHDIRWNIHGFSVRCVQD